jgi:hypothetical protein
VCVVSHATQIATARSFAVDTVTALEQYLAMLLGVTDVLAQQRYEVASGELRRALERSIRALRVLREELVMIEVIEQYLERQQHWPAPS